MLKFVRSEVVRYFSVGFALGTAGLFGLAGRAEAATALFS